MKIDQRLSSYPTQQAETAAAIVTLIRSDPVSVYIDENAHITHHIIKLTQLPYEFPTTKSSQQAVFEDLDIVINAFLSEKYMIHQDDQATEDDFFIEDGYLYVPNRDGFNR